MANNANNVTNGKPKVGGAIHWAPLGTALPTSVSDDLGEAFVNLGYCSDDGLSNDNGPETDSVKAWGGDTVLTLQTDRPDTFGVTLIEVTNVDVLKVIYGENNVTVGEHGEITVKATADEMTAGSWVIDVVLKGNRAKRTVIPNGTITELGTISYTDGDAVGYEITITDVPDGSGVYHYEYLAAPSTQEDTQGEG